MTLRFTPRGGIRGADVDLEAIERDLKAAKTELVVLEENAAQDRADCGRAERQIAKAQRAFDAEGGAVALDRAGLKQTLKEVEKRIDWLQIDLKRLAESSLPLGLAPNLMARLNDVVSRGGLSTGAKAIGEFLDTFRTSDRTKASKRPNWTESHFSALRAFLDEAYDDTVDIALDADRAWIKSRIDVVDVDLRGQAADLGSELERGTAPAGMAQEAASELR